MANGNDRPISNPGTEEGHERGEAPPRAFATGTGYALQVAGLLLALGSCLFWFFSRRVIAPSVDGDAGWLQHLRGESSVPAILTVVAATSLVGGIGLMTVGTGLQAERRTSGRDAMIVTGCMVGIYSCVCALLLFSIGSWVAAIPVGILAVISAVLFMLAGHSASILRKYPPPPDQNVVTEEFRRKFNEERRERMKKYDL